LVPTLPTNTTATLLPGRKMVAFDEGVNTIVLSNARSAPNEFLGGLRRSLASLSLRDHRP
jgi:hypothetical protein